MPVFKLSVLLGEPDSTIMLKVITFITCITLLIFGCSIVGAVTPTISNVSGIVSNGQPLTVSGLNLMQEITGEFTPSAGGFEGGNYSEDGWTVVNGDGAYSTSERLIGSQSFRANISGSGGTNCPIDNAFGDSIYRLYGEYGKMYFKYGPNFETYWDTASYIKFIEYVSPTGVYIQPVPASGGPTQVLTEITGPIDVNMSLPYTLEVDRWYLIEWRLNSSGLTIWIDTQLIGTNSGAVNLGSPWPQIGIINSCPVPSGTFSMYIDGAMSSSSRIYPSSTIEISGDDGNSWVYQEPTSLSDTSVGIIANLPPLTGSDYLLRVISSTRETSSNYILGTGSSAAVRSNGFPGSSLVSGTTSTPMSLNTDTNSTCKFGAIAGTAYASIANTFTTTSGTTHSQTLTGLTDGCSTTYYVRCDNGLEVNTTDYSITVAVDEATATIPTAGTLFLLLLESFKGNN